MLSTQVNTFYAILDDNRQIAITSKQKDAIMKMRQDDKIPQNRMIEIGNFNGELRKIKEIIPIPQQPRGQGYYCDFGIFHHLHESCNCPKRFYCNPGSFSERLYTMFPNVSYNNQIQKHMRDAVLKSFGLNTFNN